MTGARGVLVTADGTEFRGRSVGAAGAAVGEVVFNTAMTGYQEVVTDPSFTGQIVAMTTAHVGTYGVAAADAQSDRPRCAAMVIRALSPRPSSWRADGALGDYLTSHGIVALDGVDTRRLTRHVRSRGAMPAAIGVDVDAAELRDRARAAPALEGRDLATAVSTPEPYRVEAVGERRARVVAYDFGMKRDLVRQLTARGLAVTVVPAATPAKDVVASRPDGVFLSNGPGDPAPLAAAVAAVRGMLGEVPIFGVCLGHQILARALGAATFKLPFGHHGGNHPVRDLATGRVAITSQNHGFAVDLWPLAGMPSPPHRHRARAHPEQLPRRVATRYGDVVATHQNLNDGTLEGLACPDAGAFSVQYHPEAAPGPNDALGLFDRFAAAVGAAPGSG